MKPIVCIVLPTYNEAENIQKIIPLIFAKADKIATHTLHVLVVDDNSPDGTGEIVQKQMTSFPFLHLTTGDKKGLGDAYKRGIAHAIHTLNPDLLIEMDADLQHSPSLLPLFVTLANHGFSLVIGSRFAAGGQTPNFSLYRTFISRAGNALIRILGGIPRIHDCTSGFRCIKTEIIKKCDLSFLSTRGYSFQSSFLCELLRNGAKVIEVPITFPDRIHGESKLRFQDQIEFLLNVFRIRFRQSHEFIKFCTVGSSGVLINLGVYLTLTRQYSIPLEYASPIAIETSIISNFLINNAWTFRDRNPQTPFLRRLFWFHTIAAFSGTINYLLLLLLVHIFHFWDIPAYLLGISCGTLINYFLNSWHTWNKLAPNTKTDLLSLATDTSATFEDNAP